MSLPAFNRKNPCLARLKLARKLSADTSPKDTRHFELDLRGSGMTFEPGDSLAVLRSRLVAAHPHLGRIDEVAESAVFLCSSSASYITGTILPVDGGRTI